MATVVATEAGALSLAMKVMGQTKKCLKSSFEMFVSRQGSNKRISSTRIASSEDSSEGGHVGGIVVFIEWFGRQSTLSPIGTRGLLLIMIHAYPCHASAGLPASRLAHNDSCRYVRS